MPAITQTHAQKKKKKIPILIASGLNIIELIKKHVE